MAVKGHELMTQDHAPSSSTIRRAHSWPRPGFRRRSWRSWPAAGRSARRWCRGRRRAVRRPADRSPPRKSRSMPASSRCPKRSSRRIGRSRDAANWAASCTPPTAGGNGRPRRRAGHRRIVHGCPSPHGCLLPTLFQRTGSRPAWRSPAHVLRRKQRRQRCDAGTAESAAGPATANRSRRRRPVGDRGDQQERRDAGNGRRLSTVPGCAAQSCRQAMPEHARQLVVPVTGRSGQAVRSGQELGLPGARSTCRTG